MQNNDKRTHKEIFVKKLKKMNFDVVDELHFVKENPSIECHFRVLEEF